MALEIYRVVKEFEWEGWLYKPGRLSPTDERNPTYAGSIWPVDNHPRRLLMLEQGFVTGDAGVDVNVWSKDSKNQRLLRPYRGYAVAGRAEG